MNRVNGRVTLRPPQEDVKQKSGWLTAIFALQLGIGAMLLATWGELQFQAMPKINAAADEAARQQKQAQTLSDAAGLLTQREAELIVQQSELKRLTEANLRAAGELHDKLREKP